jgi:hypothetical protein
MASLLITHLPPIHHLHDILWSHKHRTTMEWPDSVHIDTLSTHKAARKLRSRNPEGIDKRYTAGQREEYRRARRDAHPFIPSGVVLHAGERGAAVLRSIREDVVVSGKRRNGKHQAPRQRWDWEFANLTRPGE